MALLNDAPRSATVRLLEESSFICIDRRAFKLAMASLARNMLKNKRPEKRTESDIMVGDATAVTPKARPLRVVRALALAVVLALLQLIIVAVVRCCAI